MKKNSYLRFLSSTFLLLSIRTLGIADQIACEETPKEASLTFRHREPNGIGYSPGYSSVDLFYAPDTKSSAYPFIDLRSHFFNNGKVALNTGVGLRYLPDTSSVIVGGNLYWDFRQAKHTHFNQFGAGLEFLWPRWDIRINGYFPTNRKKHYHKYLNTVFQEFKGNNAYYVKKYELGMIGGDVELGYLLYNSKNFNWEGDAGFYYFNGDFNKHATGGLLRTKLFITDYVVLEGQVSYDNLFNWIGQGELSLRIPFGKRVPRSTCRNLCPDDLLSLERKLVDKPQRFEIIVTKSVKKKHRVRGPQGNILNFVFVNNTSSSNGTIESPFPTLAQAQAASQPGDIIYIFPGDGTTTGMDTGINLQDNQSLVGSGVDFTLSTSLGTMTIPAQTSTTPTITAPLNTRVVFCANNNTINGLTIVGQGSGRLIQTLGFNSGVISNNTLIGGVANTRAVDLQNTTGNFLVLNNTVLGDAVVFITSSSGNTNSSNTQIMQNTINGSINMMFSSAETINTVYIQNNNVNSSVQLGVNVQQNGDGIVNIYSNNNNLTGNVLAGAQYRTGGTSAGSLQVISRNDISTGIGGIPGFLFIAGGSTSLVDADLRSDVGIGSVGFQFDQTGTNVLRVHSPNLHLSGLQTINTGTTSSTGTITFVP